MKKRTITYAAIIAAVLSVGIGGGIAFGVSQSVPDSGGVIHGCYKPSGYATGALMVIDTDLGQTCPSDTTSVNWNEVGPAGPSTAGSSGLDETTVIEQTGGGGQTSVDANCPGDHPYATGGGIYQQPSVSQPVTIDRPAGHSGDNNIDPSVWSPASVAESWDGGIASNPSDAIFTVYAICSK